VIEERPELESDERREAPLAAAAPTFREVFERELPFVYNSLRRLGIRPADLPDVTQEVFATVASILGDYDPSRPLRPWLFGIAYRVGLRYAQSAYRRREVPSEIPEAPDSTPGADVAIERSQTKELVRAALDAVEPSRRAVLILSHFEQMSVADIARALDIPVNTAYSRLHRARTEFAAAAQRLGWRSA
jgi:RNA polymerase sigma-70 factor (ECF subfamily)